MPIDDKKSSNHLIINSFVKGVGITVLLFIPYFWFRLKASSPMAIIADSFLLFVAGLLCLCSVVYLVAKREESRSSNDVRKP